MTQPTISILIPTLNVENTLERTLESLRNQSLINKLEIIIIDGESTDGTLNIVKKHRDIISTVETTPANGVANALNTGLTRVSGDLIACLNADDLWSNNTAETISKLWLRSEKKSIICGGVKFFTVDKKIEYYRYPDIRSMRRRMSIFHPSTFVPTDIAESIGAFNEKFKYAMDSEWFHRAMEQQISFLTTTEILSEMSLGGLSDRHYIKALLEYRDSLIQHKITSRTSATICFLYVSFFKTLTQNSWGLGLKNLIKNNIS